MLSTSNNSSISFSFTDSKWLLYLFEKLNKIKKYRKIKHKTKIENRIVYPNKIFFYSSTGLVGSTGFMILRVTLTNETIAPQSPPPKLNSLISSPPIDAAIPAPFP